MSQPIPRLSVIQGGHEEARAVGPVPEPAPVPRPPPASLPLLFLVLSVSAAFVVRFGLLAPVWVAFGAALPFLSGIVVGPLWGRRSLWAFDRDAARQITTGQGSALLGRWRRALGMRLFAPPVLVAEREGWALAESGDPVGAQNAYRRAMEAWGEEPPLSVLLGYAHASYSVGDDVEAVHAYERVLHHLGAAPGLEARLSLARARCRQRNRFHMRSV